MHPAVHGLVDCSVGEERPQVFGELLGELLSGLPAQGLDDLRKRLLVANRGVSWDLDRGHVSHIVLNLKT